MVKCSGFDCDSGSRDCRNIGKDGEKITFHSYPLGNPELCEKWVRANPRKYFIPTKYSKLCSLHFDQSDFVQEHRDTNVSRQKKRGTLSEKPKRRYLKDDVIPSIFSNSNTSSLSKTQDAPLVTSRTTLSCRNPEDVKRLESFEHSSLELGAICNLALTEVEDQLKDENCDVPLTTTVWGEHFMNIAGTLVKYREHGFLCDTVLVAKCGRELKAHSALLAAVSPVFLMEVEEKQSVGPYHLYFPLVEFEVLEIAVRFVYTGKLFLPTVYSEMDQLSKLFNELSDLGLDLHKLQECEKMFLRNASQLLNWSGSVKVENADRETSLEGSVQPVQADAEWSTDIRPLTANAANEEIVAEVAPLDARASPIPGDSEISHQSTLAKQTGQGKQKQVHQKRKRIRIWSESSDEERMPGNAELAVEPNLSIPKTLVDDPNARSTALPSFGNDTQELNDLPVVLLSDENVGKSYTSNSHSSGVLEKTIDNNEEPNLETEGETFNLVDAPATEGALRPKCVEEPVAKRKGHGNQEHIREKRKHRKTRKEISSDQALPCEHCEKPDAETFPNEIELYRHKIKNHWDQCNVCNICGRKLSSRRTLKYHMDSHLGIRSQPIKNHKCNVCGKHFVTPKQLKNHMLRHTGEKPHQCPQCGKRFTLRENSRRHQLLHVGYDPYLCDFCGKGFSRRVGLRDHVLQHHNFECALCSSKQTSRADMKKHAVEVHELDEFVKFSSIIKIPTAHLCDLCGTNCFTACSLRYHLRRHKRKRLHGGKIVSELSVELVIKERPFVCDVCQRAYTVKSSLFKHLRTHSQEKSFLCDICSHSFSCRDELKRHIEVHTTMQSDKLQFICVNCDKLFTSKHSLMVHNRIHTGERPYSCTFCGKRFMENSSLKVHTRMHTGEKPFACTLCEMSFAQSQHLTRHIRKHTGEKPFACKICSKSYKNKIDLRHHLMRCHKVDVTLKSLSENGETDRESKVHDAISDASNQGDCNVDE